MIKLHPAPKTKKLKKTENKVALRSAPQKKKKKKIGEAIIKQQKFFSKGIEFTKATSLLKNSALCSVLFFWSIYQWLLF